MLRSIMHATHPQSLIRHVKPAYMIWSSQAKHPSAMAISPQKKCGNANGRRALPAALYSAAWHSGVPMFFCNDCHSSDRM